MTKREDELKRRLDELELEQEIERRWEKFKRVRCAAFWSLTVTITSIIGGVVTKYSDIIKTGIKAMMEAWLAK